MSRVPYGARQGFSLAGDVGAIAAWYEVRPQRLRRIRNNAAPAIVREARHALMWKLVAERGFKASVVARLLHCGVSTVREGVRVHQERIDLFRLTFRLESDGPTKATPAL